MRSARHEIRNNCRLLAGAGSFLILFFSSCTELKRPEPNPYLSETQPPQVKELRWSNRALPTSLDPAAADSAPETDVARLVNEGLTLIDPRTLEAVPGVANSWKMSDDGLEWTFELRSDAKWSNGRALTANDFVRSWQRLNQLGSKAAHWELLDNFARSSQAEKPANETASTPPASVSDDIPGSAEAPEAEEALPFDPTADDTPNGTDLDKFEDVAPLEIRAPDAQTLILKLMRPDKDLPRLVSHPIFSPIYGVKAASKVRKLSADAVTNGAYRLTSIDEASIVLERSESYWNADAVQIDKITFLALAKPDAALAAYREGKVDIVTNTEFAPLAQKLFSPYADFKKNTFAALNFYEVNSSKPPFNDRRVREALAIAIEREKLTESELEGSTQPALSFLPFSVESRSKIVQDKERAAELLEQAGFPNGTGFPAMRLVINRNETQQRVARAAARMWKANLNVETDIVIAEPSELGDIRAKGNFDLIRRGVVFPTNSEIASLSSIFGSFGAVENVTAPIEQPSPTSPPANVPNVSGTNVEKSIASPEVVSEAQALFELRAIPLYFPITFALVKPYVDGFETNNFDIQSPTSLSINQDWRPRQQ